MSRWKRREHRVPGLNVASLPDLIFTVLFFFMIVTHMRDVTPKVKYQVPQGTELSKAPSKSGLVYIFIGEGDTGETRIQLNDRYVTVAELGAEIEKIRSKMAEADRQNMVVSIRADRHTEMGIINDVKQELRKVGALNINYSAEKKRKKEASI